MKLHSAFLVLFLFSSAVLATAQQAKPAQPPPPQRPPSLITPEVHSDNSVTFRFRAPNAQEVKLDARRHRAGRHAERRQGRLDRDHRAAASGLLRILHSSSTACARSILSTTLLMPNLLSPGKCRCMFPDHRRLPWELNDVPHGEIHHHFYKSAVAGDERDFYVYTPPGYDPAAKDDISRALSAARLQRRRQRMDRGRPRQRDSRQPDRAGQSQADDRGDAARLRHHGNHHAWDGARGAIPMCATRISRTFARRCSPKSCRRSRANIGSRKIAIRARLPDSRWADQNRC